MIDDNEIKEKCNKFNAIIEERIKLISFQEKIELINTILSKTNIEMFYVKEQRKRIEEKSLRLSFDLIIGASQVEYYDEILITLFEVDSYFCKSLMSANKISFIELDNNCKVIIDEYYFICKNIMIQLSGDNWYLTFDELLNKLIKE